MTLRWWFDIQLTAAEADCAREVGDEDGTLQFRKASYISILYVSSCSVLSVPHEVYTLNTIEMVRSDCTWCDLDIWLARIKQDATKLNKCGSVLLEIGNRFRCSKPPVLLKKFLFIAKRTSCDPIAVFRFYERLGVRCTNQWVIDFSCLTWNKS